MYIYKLKIRMIQLNEPIVSFDDKMKFDPLVGIIRRPELCPPDPKDRTPIIGILPLAVVIYTLPIRERDPDAMSIERISWYVNMMLQ